MKKKLIFIAIVVIVALSLWYFLRTKEETVEKYTFAKVERGDLESVVAATGTLSAVTTVEVGTQVSGRIAEIFVDFNDQVKKGQLLAKLDTLVLTQAVYDAENARERSRLQLQQSDIDLKRTQYLFEQNLKTQNDLDQAEYNYNLAKSNLKSSESNLEKAKINLSYASIYSPIDGTVISRDIDVGQTVAASLSSPTLFLIANDLKKMQIQANVDESDIGQIKEKQNVRFTVQAYQNQTFEGEVSQIRLQPQTVQNVVNYTVVINVENDKEILLPGMTTTLDFIIGQAKNVLYVPNAALRIRPDEEMQGIMRKMFEERMKARGIQSGQSGGQAGASAQRAGAQHGGQRPGSSAFQGMGGGMFGMSGGNGSNTRRQRQMAFVWYFDEAKTLKMVMVRTGISDGQNTEVRSDDLKEGMEIIKTVNTEDSSASSSNRSGMPPMRMFR